jgi:predicted nucleic acid-binding protein
LANEWFLDSSYAIALAASSDQLHPKALELAQELAAHPRRLVTTRAVLFEIGNSLAKQKFRAGAAQLLAAIELDKSIDIIEIDSDLYSLALNLFSSRADKSWGLTDCLSFVVMQSHGISDALTADIHFEQAGFQALLR